MPSLPQTVLLPGLDRGAFRRGVCKTGEMPSIGVQILCVLSEETRYKQSLRKLGTRGPDREIAAKSSTRRRGVNSAQGFELLGGPQLQQRFYNALTAAERAVVHSSHFAVTLVAIGRESVSKVRRCAACAGLAAGRPGVGCRRRCALTCCTHTSGEDPRSDVIVCNTLGGLPHRWR